MKALCLLLALIAGNAWGAFAPGTQCLLDFEDNLTDSAGLNNATLTGSANYQTDGAWHGSKAFRSSAGSFTLPTGVVNPSGGTLEFSFRQQTGVVGNKILYSISAASGTRALEIYCFNGTHFYAYGNGAGGTNTAFYNSVSNNTNYYIKDTWDGVGNRQIWLGVWTVAGTVTLTQYFNSTCSSLATPSAVYFANSAVGAGIDGGFDWVRFRNVYDNTGTATIDATAAAQLSPYILNSNSNRTMPKWWFK